MPQRKGKSQGTKCKAWLGLDKGVNGTHTNALESGTEKIVIWRPGAGSPGRDGLGIDLSTMGLVAIECQNEDVYSSLTVESGGILMFSLPDQ